MSKVLRLPKGSVRIEVMPNSLRIDDATRKRLVLTKDYPIPFIREQSKPTANKRTIDTTRTSVYLELFHKDWLVLCCIVLYYITVQCSVICCFVHRVLLAHVYACQSKISRANFSHVERCTLLLDA